MTYKENLQQLLAKPGAQSALARELGIKPQAISQWLTENGRPPMQRVRAIAKFFNTTVVELLGTDGVTLGMPPQPSAGDGVLASREPPVDRPRGVLVPELDVRASGGHGSVEIPLDGNGNHIVLAEWTIPGDYLRANTPDVSAVRIIRVIGDSMEPEYPAGDRVLVDTSHRSPSPPGVYAVWDGFGLVLKRLESIIGSDPPRVRLSSANSAYPPYEISVESLVVQGRVLAKWVWK